MKILLAGRGTLVANLKQFLESECYVVSLAEGQDEALELAKLYSFDALVTELELMQGSGHRLIRALRNNKSRIPILALYPEIKQTLSLIEVLDLGADDVMKMPVDTNELTARIRSIARRPHGHARSIIEVGKLTFDIESRAFYIDGKLSNLTGFNLSILEFLMLHVGRVVSREQLLEGCWDDNKHVDERNVDAYIYRLRKAITDESNELIRGEDYISGVRGRGYMMQAPQEQSK